MLKRTGIAPSIPAPLFLTMLICSLLIHVIPAVAAPPPERTEVLRRGINITGWFRYPASRDPAVLRAWLGDAAMAGLKDAGFTFVRLAVDPAVLDGAPMRQVFLDQVRRLQRHGLAVIISPHPVGWDLDARPADRRRLVTFWRELAPALQGLAPAMTFPEVLNEPVFRDDPIAWRNLQRVLHATIRAALPDDTIILTGNDWGSIAGLLALTPGDDTAGDDTPGDDTPGDDIPGDDIPGDDINVVYSFHFYDPAELTSLAAYRPGLDRSALARLPFPESSVANCQSVAADTRDPATRDLMLFYCATNWDAPHIRTRLQDAVSWARRHGVTLLAGEFGASAALNPEARLSWLRLVRETCAANGIGWALWGYDDVMGFNIRRPPGNNPMLDHSVLKALGLRIP